MAFHWATMMVVTSTPHGKVNDVVEYKKLSKNYYSCWKNLLKIVLIDMDKIYLKYFLMFMFTCS
jgi:hypothetical protein